MEDTSTEAPNRMTRKKNRTRKILMDAVIELLLEKGYEEVMTDEITERADVGRRTFYNHFVSKEECVLAALGQRYGNYAEAMAQSLDGDADSQDAEQRDRAVVIANMASKMFKVIALDPVTEKLIDYPRILSEAIADSQRDRIVANVASGVMTGRFKPLLPPESLEPMTAWGFVGLIMASIRRKTQEADSLVWARFLLHNLGVEEPQINELLDTISV